MKPTFGLPFALGVILTIGAGCNGSSSHKDKSAANPPQLHGANEAKPAAPIGVAGSVAPGNSGNSSVPNATATGRALSGVWGLSLGQKPRTCSSIYDFRDAQSLSIHVICPSDAGRTIALQTETFARVLDDGANVTLQKTSSTCPSIPDSAAPSNSIAYSVTIRDLKPFLTLTNSAGASPELQSVDAAALAGDLKTASVLYNRPVVRGCFPGGLLAKFEAQTAQVVR